MLERTATHVPALAPPGLAVRGPIRLFAAGTLWSVSLLAMLAIAFVVASLVPGGLPELSVRFLLEPPREAGLAGGISSIVVSTALLLAVCLVTALPLSLCAGAFLASLDEGATNAKGVVRVSLDVLAALPSVVFGLFGNALFCRALGLGFSLVSGGLTLACMVLPLLVRATEQSLLDVPREYRAAARALGLSRAACLLFVELPAARTGIAAGALLATGRALSETAALIFTSGYVMRMPSSLLDSGRSLSVHIYDLAMNVSGGTGRADATALLLVGALLLGAGLAFGRARTPWRAD